MKWETGAMIRILDTTNIYGGYRLSHGEVYEIESIEGGNFYITDNGGNDFHITEDELPYVERVFTADDYAEIARLGLLDEYELSDAELGEPSVSPNVTLSEIYEEVLDMKAMIGRLIRNGGDDECE